jgi:hypothetical protein
MKRALKKFFLTNEKFYSIMVTMRNYISIGPKYQWHFTVEEDRPWLEETLADSPNYNPTLAISLNANLNENADLFGFTRIFSDKATNTNILWVAQAINRAAGRILTRAGAIHPNLRGQGYVRDIGTEDILWFDRENRWNLSKISFCTAEEFSAGENLFPELGFSDGMPSGDGIRSSVRRIG